MSDIEPVPILAALDWPENGHLIAACARLGYLDESWVTLDPTYGAGTWWKFWRPRDLVTFNRAEDGSDFRNLPLEDASVDAVAFDPPYVSKGGRETSGIIAMDERYGQDDAPATPALLQDLIDQGLTEMVRVCRKRGVILVKCQDYVSSGRYWNGTYLTQRHAIETLGLHQIDRFEHYVKSPRPQPKRTRKGPPGPDGKPTRIPSPQVHARRNLSTLFVFRKP